MYKPLALALTPRPRPEQVTREEAERRILEQDEPYKLEILNRIKSDRITIWHTSKKQVHSKKYRSQARWRKAGGTSNPDPDPDPDLNPALPPAPTPALTPTPTSTLTLTLTT